jgi:protein ImuB
MAVEIYQPARETKTKRKKRATAKPAALEGTADTDSPTENSEEEQPLSLPDLAMSSQPRPSWILEMPLKLILRNERPFYRRPLKVISRTERIEAGWWDGNGVQRDYYIASDDRGRMFWLYRERLSGDWFLHGFFG